MAEIDQDSSKTFSIGQGKRVLLFGLIMGFTGYLAGVALSIRADTILEMVSWNGDASGTDYKNYDTLNNVFTDNFIIFTNLFTLQQIAPLFYIFFIELGVFCSTYLTMTYLKDPVEDA